MLYMAVQRIKRITVIRVVMIKARTFINILQWLFADEECVALCRKLPALR